MNLYTPFLRFCSPLLALLPLASLAPSCSSPSSDGTQNGASTSACFELVDAFCNRANTCWPVGLRSGFGDVETCIRRTRLACSSLQLPGSSWTDEKIGRCMQQIRTAPCDEEADEEGACATEPGSLANGSPCVESSQCAGGSCERALQTNDAGVATISSCGTCTTKTPSSCGDAGVCASPDSCVLTTSGSFACRPPVPAGQPCTSGTGRCASGFVCRDSVCAKPGAVGETCSTSLDCQASDGLRCVDQTCQSPIFKSAGEACDSQSVCTGGARCLPPTATTGVTRTCVAPAAEGSACDSTKGPPCQDPASCRQGICTIYDATTCQ